MENFLQAYSLSLFCSWEIPDFSHEVNPLSYGSCRVVFFSVENMMIFPQAFYPMYIYSVENLSIFPRSKIGHRPSSSLSLSLSFSLFLLLLFIKRCPFFQREKLYSLPDLSFFSTGYSTSLFRPKIGEKG